MTEITHRIAINGLPADVPYQPLNRSNRESSRAECQRLIEYDVTLTLLMGCRCDERSRDRVGSDTRHRPGSGDLKSLVRIVHARIERERTRSRETLDGPAATPCASVSLRPDMDCPRDPGARWDARGIRPDAVGSAA